MLMMIITNTIKVGHAVYFHCKSHTPCAHYTLEINQKQIIDEAIWKEDGGIYRNYAHDRLHTRL